MADPNPQPPGHRPLRGPPRFDALQAWNAAMSAIKANREMLLVIAGLFFLLPQLALSFTLPEVPPDLSQEEAQKVALEIYTAYWPLLLAAVLIQAIGTLCVIVLLSDRARPTVGNAIVRAAQLMPVYFAAQLVIAAGVGIGLLSIVLVASLTGNEAVVAFGTAAALALAVWIFVRTCLTAPIIAAESLKNPFEAIQRSWQATDGAAARLFLFFVLLTVAAAVVYAVATVVPGAILMPLAGNQTATIILGLVSSTIASAFSLVFAALLIAIYGQLSAARTAA